MDEKIVLKEITEDEYEQEHNNISKTANQQENKSPQLNNTFHIPTLFLMSGNDLKLSPTLSCKHPTIQEIFDIDKKNFGFQSENYYYLYLNLFIADPYDYMVYLYDKGYDYEQVSPFKLFLLRFEDFIFSLKSKYQNQIESNEGVDEIIKIFKTNIYYLAFNFFLGIDEFYIAQNANGSEIIVDKNNDFILNEEGFNLIHQFIKDMNGFEIPKDRINPANETVKEMLIEDMREDAAEKEMMRKRGLSENQQNDILAKRLSTITWISSGITPFNRNQLHIYDITDGFNMIGKKNNYDNTLLGVFARYIDPKSVNMQEIYWAN